MANLTLQSPLSGHSRKYLGITLREMSDFEIVSIAVVNGEETNFGKMFKKAFDAAPPSPATFSQTKTGKVLWTGQSQYFLFQDGQDDRLDEALAKTFEGKAYTTLQTDGWAAVEVAGSRVHDLLERFIPLDISHAKIGFGARTTAHHMSVLVMKTSEDTYELLTPRSSSKTFLEALEHVTGHISRART